MNVVVQGAPEYEIIVPAQSGPLIEVATAVGPPGPPGPSGPTGSPGPDSVPFEFSQLSASSQWTIVHNLGRYPSVTVVDSAGQLTFGTVSYRDLNSVIISFSAAFSGSATLF